MDCAEARLLLSRSFDGELTLEALDEATLQSHLVACAACRALRADLAVEQELLADLWPPVSGPAGFAERVVAALPERRSRRHPLAIAAAFLLVLLAGGILSQGPARASIGPFLRQVVLRESPALTEPSRTLLMTQLRLEEAQRLVPWHIHTSASRLICPTATGSSMSTPVRSIPSWSAQPSCFTTGLATALRLRAWASWSFGPRRSIRSSNRSRLEQHGGFRLVMAPVS
jgi:hypothetical protein